MKEKFQIGDLFNVISQKFRSLIGGRHRREATISNENQVQGIFEGFVQGQDGKDSYAMIGAIDNRTNTPVLLYIRIATQDETRAGSTGWISGEEVTVYLSEIEGESIGLDQKGRRIYNLNQRALIRILNDAQRNAKKSIMTEG